MSQKKPSFIVEDVLPDDEHLGIRNAVWRKFMDTFIGPALNMNRFHPIRSQAGLDVYKCPRHCQTVIVEQLKLCFWRILRALHAISGWFVLRERKKRKLEPSTPDDREGEHSGEPAPKYVKVKERQDLVLNDATKQLDYMLSDDSSVHDVEEAGNDDSDQENREEINKQLKQVVVKRKRKWEKTGLQQLMENIEDDSHQFNMLSHEKVENWLFNRPGGSGAARAMTQGHETLMTEQNEDGDRVRFHRKQQMTVSSKDEEDSLYSVDTAQYIMSSNSKKNSIRTECIKVTRTIKQFTISTNNALGTTFHPKLHSISSFPAIEEEHLSALSASRQLSKSDPSFEVAEDKTLGGLSKQHVQAPPPPTTKLASTAAARKKVFKKTMKKNTKSSKSPTAKRTVANEQFEQALQNVSKVKKVPLIKSKKNRIDWKETSYLDNGKGKKVVKKVSSSSSSNNNSSDSEDENDEVFLNKDKRKQKTPPKRELRRRPLRRMSDSCESSPPKKSNSPRKKSSERDLVAPFEAICLSPRKRTAAARLQERYNATANTDQTTNLTALFSGANEKISNSTKITNVTTSSANITSNASTSSRRVRDGFPDLSRCIVVYQPKQIQSDVSREERVRVTVADLNLDNVVKPRHLEKFKKFNYLIHPNSSVRFFPSDSEEDEPNAVSVSTGLTDDDESYDDDDPILTFNPRYDTDRLNVMECPHE